ncbi:MAG: hypothetical protein BGO98_02075 [Myxococcales bacterium 68-20]|nr:MAG: hypothetical protein BGO98_02075 [Myxococcales bacterium 68-20]
MREIDSIKKSLADLRELAPEEPECWKTRPPLTEVAVRAIEKKLGFALPPGHRAFVREIGDGGAGFGAEITIRSLAKLTASDIARARKEFPLREKWFPPDPDSTRARREQGLRAKNKRNAVELPKGASPIDGTIPLGVPTGTHEYYQLVLRGPHAGEVWIDATGEDSGGVTPAKPAAFLALVQSFLRNERKELRGGGDVRATILAGGAKKLLASKTGSARTNLETQISDVAHELFAERGLAPTAYAGVAEAFMALGGPKERPAALAFLMAGDFARAFELAASGYAAGPDPLTRDLRFRPVHGIHLLVARAALGRSGPKLDLPTSPAKYSAGASAIPQFQEIAARLSPDAKMHLATELPPSWRTLLTR